MMDDLPCCSKSYTTPSIDDEDVNWFLNEESDSSFKNQFTSSPDIVSLPPHKLSNLYVALGLQHHSLLDVPIKQNEATTAAALFINDISNQNDSDPRLSYSMSLAFEAFRIKPLAYELLSKLKGFFIL